MPKRKQEKILFQEEKSRELDKLRGKREIQFKEGSVTSGAVFRSGRGINQVKNMGKILISVKKGKQC